MESNDPQPDQHVPLSTGESDDSSIAGHVAGTLAPTIAQLSPREREVALLLARGLSNRRIAEVLHIGQRTAESHVARLKKKLGRTSRAQVMLWALASFPAADSPDLPSV